MRQLLAGLLALTLVAAGCGKTEPAGGPPPDGGPLRDMKINLPAENQPPADKSAAPG